MARDEELQSIVDAFRAVHPDAEPIHEWGIDGWSVQVRDEPPEGYKGTMDSTRLMLLPTEKKAGLTIHLWDPRDPERIAKHAEALKEAGFKPMVGCLQWNRKAPVDLDALRTLFEATRV